MRTLDAISQYQEEIAALKQERAELAAMLAVKDAALELVEYATAEYNERGDAEPLCPVCENFKSDGHKNGCLLAKALSITCPAAVHEIRAQVLEESCFCVPSKLFKAATDSSIQLAEKLGWNSCCDEMLRALRSKAAAERAKGEK